jgi:hypothetical protein
MQCFILKASLNKKNSDECLIYKAQQNCHPLHNSYILALKELNGHSKIVKETLLPNLLKCNRKIAENILAKL